MVADGVVAEVQEASFCPRELKGLVIAMTRRYGCNHGAPTTFSREGPQHPAAERAAVKPEELGAPFRMLAGECDIGLADIPGPPQKLGRGDDIALPADRRGVECAAKARLHQPVPKVDVLIAKCPAEGETQIKAADPVEGGSADRKLPSQQIVKVSSVPGCAAGAVAARPIARPRC